MKDGKIQIALIGAGRAGMIHAVNFKHAVDGAELYAIADANEQAAAEAAKKLEVARFSSDYKIFLNDDAVDAVIVVTPTKFHCEIVCEAAAAGKHILCEKPMAMDEFECDVMAQAAKIIEESGQVDLIDINMGCPVSKIVKSGGGAALMKDPEKAEKIVQRVVEAVQLPVGVKFRLGWDGDSLNYLDFGKRMQQAGVSFVTLHARTRQQFYAGHADWNAFEKLKKVLTIPVIANGDIRTSAQAKKVLSETGVDAVMIGRGLLGKPWALAECRTGLKNGVFNKMDDISQVVLDHFHKMEKYYGHKAVFIARKHIGWYSSGMTGASAFRDRVNQITQTAELLSLIRDFFGRQT